MICGQKSNPAKQKASCNTPNSQYSTARKGKSKEHPVSGMPFPLLYSVFVRFDRKCGFAFSKSHAFPELCIYQAVAISSTIPVDFTNAPVSQTIPVPRLVSTMLPLGYTERSAAHIM